MNDIGLGLGVATGNNDELINKMMTMSPKERRQFKALMETSCSKLMTQVAQHRPKPKANPQQFDFFVSETAKVPSGSASAAAIKLLKEGQKNRPSSVNKNQYKISRRRATYAKI
jgi:hypothetical protein